jgi:predicted MFS family arabinose efflux permease
MPATWAASASVSRHWRARKGLTFVAMARLSQRGSSLWRRLEQYRAAFAERNVALLLVSGFISEIGDWFNIVALLSLSYHLGDGALGAGSVLAVRMLTTLLFQGPAGAFVDRYPGRRVLFGSQILMAVIASAFALVAYIPHLWLIYLLVVLLNIVGCVAQPAFMVALKAEAPDDLRSQVNGALFASMTSAQLIGPVVGGLALVAWGGPTVFLLNGLTFFAVAIAITRLRGGLEATSGDSPHLASVAPAVDQPPQGVRGYRWLFHQRTLILYVLVSLSLALLAQATIALFITRSEMLGLEDGGVGLFYTAIAAGSLAGSIIAGISARHTVPLLPAAVAMALSAITLAIYGVVSTAAVAIAALVVAGFTTDTYEVIGLTYFQESIPDVVFGRFFSLFLIGLSAGGMIGALAGPLLERIVGVSTALILLAIPGLVLAIALAITLIVQRESSA